MSTLVRHRRETARRSRGSARQIISRNVLRTQRLGALLGQLAEKGDVILLQGELGAGKTALAQGIAHGLHIHGYVTSPTFTLVNEYYGRLPFYHVDLYRIDEAAEAAAIGLEEYLYGKGISVVEWPERAAEIWPEEYLLIKITDLGGNKRRLVFKPQGRRYRKLLAELRAKGFGHQPSGR